MDVLEPQKHSHIFRVLDHCGCIIRAIFLNDTPTNLEYYSTCYTCRDYLSYKKYIEIYQMCADETQRYKIQDLTHCRGWITRNEIIRLVGKLNIEDNKNNAKQLVMRMSIENYRPEKIENNDAIQTEEDPS